MHCGPPRRCDWLAARQANESTPTRANLGAVVMVPLLLPQPPFSPPGRAWPRTVCGWPTPTRTPGSRATGSPATSTTQPAAGRQALHYQQDQLADEHRHVRADAYRVAGGFQPLPVGEDRALVAALEAPGFRVKRTSRNPVSASARRNPRAHGGFGNFLRGLDALPGRLPRGPPLRQMQLSTARTPCGPARAALMQEREQCDPHGNSDHPYHRRRTLGRR